MFQSTRPRGTRPRRRPTGATHGQVSIHASARDATQGAGAVLPGVRVSIHASARDATKSPQAPVLRLIEFQSTRPRGTRPAGNPGQRSGGDEFQSTRPRGTRLIVGSYGIWYGQQFQSTRPRGTRPRGEHQIPGLGPRFNPRVREGRDTTGPHGLTPFRRFQSTRPRGTRHPPPCPAAPPPASFNPRVREGRDLNLEKSTQALVLFQSTRPRGTRRLRRPVLLKVVVFQSTRPRGTRHYLERYREAEDACFNPRVREGRDHDVPSLAAEVIKVSIHASARDATLRLYGLRREVAVSIHASARDATAAFFASSICATGFNPRVREGRDGPIMVALPGEVSMFQSTRPRGTRLLSLRIPSIASKVSIHASARDATKRT